MTTSPSKPAPVTGRALLARLLKLAHAYAEERAKRPATIKELRAIADWLEGVPADPKVNVVEDERVLRIFNFWAKKVDKPQSKLTPGRRAKIRSRLKEGYTEEDILRAITNVAASPFHMGDNKEGRIYNDLELILRNGEKLEGYRDLAGTAESEPLPNVAKATDEQHLAKLRQRAMRELEEGKTDAYNRTQAEIKQLRSA